MNSYTGIVQKGAKRGIALGYPTANISLQGEDISGIYVARVYVKEGEAPYIAAVFADPKRKILEAYLLDFSNDLYGQTITVELHKKIRESATFSDDAVLRATIAHDVESVRAYFKK